MKTKTRLLALLLALIMVLTSCNFGGPGEGGGEGGGGTEPPIVDVPSTDKEDEKHTVTFVTLGGNDLDPIKVEDGDRLTGLPTPKKDGHKFLGWYTDEDCTTKWKNSTRVTGDVTLYAGWKELYVFDRDANSTSPEEIVTWYTATPEEFAAAKTVVEEMEALGMSGPMEDFDVKYGEFETAFYHLAEQMTVASIIYYCNMSDEVAQERHLDTTEKFRELQDAYMMACQRLLVNSPYTDELFADWTEEEKQELLNYSPEIMAIRNQIDELQVEYNDLEDTDYGYAEKVVEIYKQIVVLNNQLAAKFGYDNYYVYASENIYGRDYTTEDLADFHAYVKSNVATKISTLVTAWRAEYQSLGSFEDTYNGFMDRDFDSMEDNYLMMYLESLGDTNMGVAMRDVFNSQNCVFADNKNSHPTAFQTWLYESEKPFCLFGSNGQSATTIVHEIGHYYAAYTNDDISDYDLCETHSQSNEFLFMHFCSDKLPKNVYKASMLYQLVNTFGTITLASIVDQFEQKVYSLSDEEITAMTVEDFDGIMNEITSAIEYKGVLEYFIDPTEYWKLVAVDNPVYYVSYSVSAVASINVYTMALEDTDAAYTAYRALVETEGIDEMGYVEALAAAGVASPFDKEAFTNINSLILELTK